MKTRIFKHVIQARITVTKEKYQCKCGKVAAFLYMCYEPHKEEDEIYVQQEAAKFASLYEALQHNKKLPLHDAIYEATLKEQREQPPQEHMRDYDCFGCSSSLLTHGMGIPNCGEELLTRLEKAGHEHALWIIRDVSRPDRWAITMSPHHDAAKLQEELYKHAFSIDLRKASDG